LSKLFYDTVPLADVVGQSSLIVVAKAADPFQKTEQRKIRKGPAFSWVVYRFKVSEVLFQESPEALADSVISVSTFDDDNFKYHRKYYEDGLSVSRHVSQYRPASEQFDFAEESATSGIVLFLIPDPGVRRAFRFATQCGMESINKLPDIVKLIEKTDRKVLRREILE
jgi:hypothetical protein